MKETSSVHPSKPGADSEPSRGGGRGYARRLRLGVGLLCVALAATAVPVYLHQQDLKVSQAHAIALDGIRQRGSDWRAAKLLGYVAVIAHSDERTRSALADTLAMERRGLFPGSTVVTDISLSADGETALVSDVQQGYAVWRLRKSGRDTGRENLHASRTGTLNSESGLAGLSSNGRKAVTADRQSGDISMWDLSDPDEPSRVSVRKGNYRDTLLEITLSADGTTLFAGFEGGSIEIWDLGAGREPSQLVRMQAHAAGVRVLSATSDGKTLLTLSDDSAIFWSLADGRRPARLAELKSATLEPKAPEWSSGAISADGKRAIIGRGVWDTTDPRSPARLGNLSIAPKWGTPVAMSRDGSVATTVHDELGGTSGSDPVVLWGLKDGNRPAELASLRVPESESRLVAMSEDGRTLTVGTGSGAYSWLLPGLRTNFVEDVCRESRPLPPSSGYWESVSTVPAPDMLGERPFAICPQDGTSER
ncbi:WD40 repeat domain-containing protein [Nonomuraea sp. NN258]|uniref:WD40 repeat domain-containing protein n=1 Tax=Nonomuraea antri TaxID=2730852 RepID=UPI00156818ED|nr:WD40 repeat domain-containing protein [Nonomuraea antri]NRQ40104.1 WD40 repeat domain-containing protein [Nonomuraea antri]